MNTSVKRILQLGWERFSRDKSSSGAALFVVVIVLMVMTMLSFLQGASSFMITSIQESVDISTYLKSTAQESEIFELRSELESIPEVKKVEYVSKEKALEQFVEAHKQDEVIMASLDAVGQNPLLASLNIRAYDPSQYSLIAEFLESTSFAAIISNVDYHDRAPVIERLSVLAGGIKTSVFATILFSALIAILVAFNTIRLTIYNSRDEIEVMRLVGASNWFIQGPFLIQGIIVGALASVISLLLLFPMTLFLSFKLDLFLGDFNLFGYFIDNFFILLLLQLVVGIGLGVISSMIAIRRYLKI